MQAGVSIFRGGGGGGRGRTNLGHGERSELGASTKRRRGAREYDRAVALLSHRGQDLLHAKQRPERTRLPVALQAGRVRLSNGRRWERPRRDVVAQAVRVPVSCLQVCECPGDLRRVRRVRDGAHDLSSGDGFQNRSAARIQTFLLPTDHPHRVAREGEFLRDGKAQPRHVRNAHYDHRFPDVGAHGFLLMEIFFPPFFSFESECSDPSCLPLPLDGAGGARGGKKPSPIRGRPRTGRKWDNKNWKFRFRV